MCRDHLRRFTRAASELCHISPQTPGKHRGLRGDADSYRCCGKSLIGSALVRFGVRQHARKESISKRAHSTTRTSLRFRINDLRGPKRVYRKTLLQIAPFRETVFIQQQRRIARAHAAGWALCRGPDSVAPQRLHDSHVSLVASVSARTRCRRSVRRSGCRRTSHAADVQRPPQS